jgi:hypothetical protein
MKHHYHLAATKVVWANEAAQQMSEVNLNVMLRLNSRNVIARDIGTIQQQAQILFYKNIDETDREQIKIADVFVYGLSYLGKMTEEEFTFRPETEAPMAANSPAVPAPVPGTGAFD